MSEKLKKLTSKNPKYYEPVAYSLINSCDIELFAELVSNDDYLFDFIKNNVAKRIKAVCNKDNYLNLIHFLKYYSPAYEDAIISSLIENANEDLTDTMLEKFEYGTEDEKTYSAKYFEYVKDPLAYNFLIKNSYSDFEYLSYNCANTLAAWNDRVSYDTAIEKLNNKDDFEKIAAVKFLIAYGSKEAVLPIINAMKNSTMAENIAGEIPYLINLSEVLDLYFQDALLVINYIINGLGEILPLNIVLDFEFYDIFERLLSSPEKCAIVLLNAIEKFETLTENDEYLFDENPDTRNEIKDVKRILNNADKKFLRQYINNELNEKSPFVYTALEFATDIIAIRELLKSDNQTLVLRTAEILKKLNAFDETAKTVALLKVTDINIKDIIRAL